MRSKLYFLLFLLLSNSLLIAQTADKVGQYTDFLPPPPNAAALFKYAAIAINKNTGAPNVSVPVFSVKGNKLSTGVNISYASTGLKVDETASRVGMGWVLNIGGVVSRVVRDKPDNLNPRRGQPWYPFGFNWSTYNYIHSLYDPIGGYDSEPDLFSFNFNGYSGTFVLNDAMQPMLISKSDIKIAYDFTSDAWNFKITTPDGVVYYFGGSSAREKTKRTSNCGKTYDTYIDNSWYLKKIQHHSGESIDFIYVPHNYSYESGVSESMYWVQSLPSHLCGPPEASSYSCTAPSNSSCVNTVVTQGVLLKHIIAQGKARVKLYYTDRQDCSDSLVSKIELIDDATLAVNRSFKFNYTDIVATGGGTGGYAVGYEHTPFLTELKELSADTLSNRSHKFSYLDPASRATRLSFAQDHWGYFNGASNNTLVPYPATLEDEGSLIDAVHFPSALANRRADSNFASLGMLSKIEYPTGGNDELSYESNRINKLVTPITFAETSGSTAGVGFSGAGLDSIILNINDEQTFELVAMATDTTANQSADFKHQNGRVQIEGSVDGIVFDEMIPLGATLVEYLPVNPSKVSQTFTVRIKSFGDKCVTAATVKYQPASISTWETVIVGGVRVKSVTTTAEGSPPMVKRYFYGNMDSLYASSLSPLPVAHYISYSEHRDYCTAQDGPLHYYTGYNGCYTGYMYSNTIDNLFDYASAAVSYQSVVESYGPSFENGGTQTDFIAVHDEKSVLVFGYEDFYMATNSNTSNALNGKPVLETVYKNNSGTLVPIKKTKYSYKKDDRYTEGVSAYAIKEKSFLSRMTAWTTFDTTLAPTMIPDFLYPISLKSYIILSDFVYNDSLTTITFDQNGLNPVTSLTRNYYDDSTHTQLTRVETENSKGEQLKTLQTYPADFAGTAVYDTMISRNLIATPVTIRQYKNDSLLTTQTFNQGFFNGTEVQLGSVTSARRSDPAYTELQVGNYDVYGNILEFTGKDGMINGFVWDYHYSLPIAKAANAPFASIAATSFESDGLGNWSFSFGGIRSDSGSVTGAKAYTLATGYVERTALDTSATYVVTYWLKNNGGTASLNGGAGGTLLIQKNGWKLYQQEIHGTDTLRISGTGVIDELRLYPKNAQMTTYTYDPLVGLTSQCDVNNRIMYYEYDSFSRLLRVRDADKNILKSFEYKYQETQ